MNINATLIGQFITFFVFVWLVMKFIWPPLINVLNERKKTIADGLSAAERGKNQQALAEQRATEVLQDARLQAAEILTRAERRASEIIEEAKEAARAEGERIKQAAGAEIEQEVSRAREQLRGQVVSLAVAGAGKVIKRELDAAAHEDLLQDLIAQI